MTVTGLFTISVIVALTIGLALEIAGADFLFFGALVLLMLAGVVTPNEALSGFSNEGMITIALLFIISRAVYNTGALSPLVSAVLGTEPKKRLSSLLIRMMVPVTVISAFLNNTPIVVMLVPVIKKWSERIGIPCSKFLIPLSYAAIFGGVCTLIGTSTNLVVHGLMLQNGFDGLSMFELAKVGIPCAVMGWIYLAFVGKKILPEHKDILEVVDEKRKEYVLEMQVQSGCVLTGQTIQQAGLRNLKGLFLVDIERQGASIGPVSGEEKITEGDRLMFAGVTSMVADLYDIKGLVPVADEIVEEDFKTRRSYLVEAVVSSNSPVLGKTIKKSNFRGQYDAAVVAVHRNGERVQQKIGSIRLRAGDTLLFLTSHDFIRRWKNSEDFYLVSNVKTLTASQYHTTYLVLGIIAAMILTVTLAPSLPLIAGYQISMLHVAAAAVVLLIATGCVRIEEARKSIQWHILITIACSFAISKALLNSGAAELIAQKLIVVGSGFGAVGVLAVLYIVTAVFTTLITNSAAAALIFPIAVSAAAQMGVQPKPFFIAIAIAASASFMTPISYQTNLIVQGAGGYTFKDYFNVGSMLTVLFFVVAIIMIPLCWKF